MQDIIGNITQPSVENSTNAETAGTTIQDIITRNFTQSPTEGELNASTTMEGESTTNSVTSTMSALITEFTTPVTVEFDEKNSVTITSSFANSAAQTTPETTDNTQNLIQKLSTSGNNIVNSMTTRLSEIFTTEKDDLAQETTTIFQNEITETVTTKPTEKVITTLSSIVDNITNKTHTDVTDKPTEKISTTISSIVENVTNRTNKVFTTASTTTTTADLNPIIESEGSGSNMYVIIGVVIAAVIILCICFYVFCKKCRKSAKTSGEYYVTQLKEGNSNGNYSNNTDVESNTNSKS